MHKARETLLKHMGKVPLLSKTRHTPTASDDPTGDLDATR